MARPGWTEAELEELRRFDAEVDAEVDGPRKSYSRAYRENHKAKMADYQRAYYEAHKAEKVAYYRAHKADIAAKHKAYRKAHKAEIAAKHKAYREAHKAELAAKQRERRQKKTPQGGEAERGKMKATGLLIIHENPNTYNTEVEL